MNPAILRSMVFHEIRDGSRLMVLNATIRSVLFAIAILVTHSPIIDTAKSDAFIVENQSENV